MTTVPAERGWTQSHPGLGLEANRPSHFGRGKDLLTAQIVRDSYGQWGAMLGIGRKWPLARWGTVTLEGGLSAGLWHRSQIVETVQSDVSLGVARYPEGTAYGTAAGTVTRLERVNLPYALPFLAISDARSGVGVNVGLAPGAGVAGQPGGPRYTLMLQMTYALP